MTIYIIASVIIGYLIGSIPSGYLIAKKRGVNITAEGSSNTGATNVARTVGKKAGIMTLFCDMAKGFFPVLLLKLFNADSLMITCCSIALVAGHCFSLPGLKGGKGIATAGGVLFAMQPVAATFGLGAFIIVFALTQIVSISSIIAAFLIPVYVFINYPIADTSIAVVIISLIVIYKHKENIKRLAEGKEQKFKIKS